MKPQSLHAHEDRLLDFAYGELPVAEARAMEAHLQGCPRCTEALDGIRGVRATMSQLSLEPAPDAGLESLLAYAQQSARHAAEGPAPVRSRWRRWLMPAMGLATVSFIGIVSLEAAKSIDLAPSATAMAPEPALAQKNLPTKAEARAYGETESAAPTTPAPVTVPAQEIARPREVALAGEKAAADKSLPELKKDVASIRGARGDWSNAGSGGGFPELRSKYKTRDDEGTSSVGNVQAIPPTAAARAEMQSAPGAVQQQAQMALPPPPPAQAAPSDDAEAMAGLSADTAAPALEESVAKAEAAPKAAMPQRSSLRIGGPTSSSYGRGAGAAPSVGSVATSENVAPAAPSPLGTARPAATVAPSKPASKLAEADAMDESFDTAVPAKKVARKERSAGPSTSELSQRANDAYRAGDRALESSLLRQALAAGATGRDRIGLLIRLCDAEFALGERESAIEACGLVLSEDPGSGAAQVARKRLSRESEPSESNDFARRAKQAAPAEAESAPAAPAEPAPARAAPASVPVRR